jgi:Transcriptional activator, adenine-specific DNA methyltransferase
MRTRSLQAQGAGAQDTAGPFNVIVADPPWAFGDKLPGEGRGAEKHYPVMKVDEIERYLPSLNLPIANDALLFLWRVSAMPEEALRVVRAWGFVPKSEIVWVKTTNESDRYSLAFGMGRYVRAAHETCIVASRGKGQALIQNHAQRSVFFAPRARHSEKPNEFYGIVQALVPLRDTLSTQGSGHLELFARRRRPGWVTLGEELVDE